MKNMKLKQILAAILALAMMLALAGCGGNQNSAGGSAPDTPETEGTGEGAEEGQPEEGGKITDIFDEGAAGEYDNTVKVDRISANIRTSTLESLSPFGTGLSDPCLWSVCECLFEMDGFGGEMIPVLADANRGEFGGYDHEAGTGDYTVYIYDYITDSAGNHITASDVKWSFDNQKENYSTDGWGTLESVEVVDDTTVIFHFTEEMIQLGGLENVLCRCFIFSEAAYNASPSKFASDLCATGPYVVSEYVPGISVTVTAREDYWQTDDSLRWQYQQANVNEIVFNMIDEEAQVIIALQQGELDIANKISSLNLTNFEEGGENADDFNVYTYSNNGVFMLVPNCDEASACNDVNLRLALFYSVNLDGLTMALGSDTISRVNMLGSNIFGDYVEAWDTAENYNTTYSEELAKEYLEKSNYSGEALDLVCPSESSAAAEILQQMWQNVGIDVKIHTYDGATMDTIVADPNEWDIEITARGSSDYVVNIWAHFFDLSHSANGDKTPNFIADPEWQEILTECCTADGHTPENLNAWWEHCVENAYCMGLYASKQNVIYSEQFNQIVKLDRDQIMPGACTYNN